MFSLHLSRSLSLSLSLSLSRMGGAIFFLRKSDKTSGFQHRQIIKWREGGEFYSLAISVKISIYGVVYKAWKCIKTLDDLSVVCVCVLNAAYDESQ